MFKRRESKLQPASRRGAAGKSKHQRRLLLEGLEQRQLLAAGITPTLESSLPTFTGPRNIGTVQAFVMTESETATENGTNDFIASADFVPLGTGPGQQQTVDINGSLPLRPVPNSTSGFRADLDVFSFDLRAGDILDVGTLGAAGGLTVQYADGRIWFATDFNVGGVGVYPVSSPLQTAGNNTAAMVVPEDGRYFLTVAPLSSLTNYTVGLRVYRPVTEQLSVGQSQVLYLDFDGGVVDQNVFNEQFGPGVQVPGIARFYGLDQSLQVLGLEADDGNAGNRLIDTIVTELERIFRNVGVNGNNGDFATTGNPGEYGITILNSRDHANLIREDDPRVTTLLIGGTNAIFGPSVEVFGVSESVDLGNFDMSELVAMPLEFYLPTVQSFPISPARSVLDGLGVFLGAVAAHEAGHSFGLWHTDNANSISNTMDSGGGFSLGNLLGIGRDGIFGTLDDEPTEFRDDFFAPEEFFFGKEAVPATLSHVLSSGTRGGGITGRVFNDVNRNGNGTGDTGLGGVTVFADINGNGVLDPSEPQSVTDANGTYNLVAAAGTYTIIAIAPPSFAGTTPTSRTAGVSLSGSTTGIDFGFSRVQADITGTKFADNNGNGFRDTGEPGIPGVYVYLDINGDDQADLGEPAAVTGADGTFSINFPGPGTYTLREVLTPGFIQTSPSTGEHTIVFNGTALADNYDFGNLPSRDYGDAPDSFGTRRSAGGPSHGITQGLTLGANVDRDLDGQPSVDATDDDTNGPLSTGGTVIDDEDGVRLISPLGPGAAATLEVTATNTSGSAAYLQAWFDFNGNGVFESSERAITNRQLDSGVTSIDVNVPDDAATGNVIARFRYSQTQNLGPGGDADTGEVEDYRFTILQAAEVVNDDTFSVPRNTSQVLDVLANDFDVNGTLRINNFSPAPTLGTARVSTDGRSIIYTAPNGFIGQDTFGYTVRDEFGVVRDENGNPVVGRVTVNVTFQSNVPIAIDDAFEVPQGSVNRALNVLDNDIPSMAGGLTISSITPGSNGGTIRITGGGQSLSYTPLPGFSGTEQFTYSVIDGEGVASTAQVTVNLLPGSRADDVVDFSFVTLDALNNTPITSIQAGQVFKLRVLVDDLRLPAFDSPEGVASAFLDVLYTDELVTPVDSDPADSEPFDVTFGPLFTGAGIFQQSTSFAPGLLDDIGGVQPISSQTEHSGPVELFTVTMRATAAGVAVFQADPADDVVSDTVVLGSDDELLPRELRLGRAELVIGPQSDNFTSAIDDSFPDGRDSSGALITPDAVAVLDVLANDLIRREEISVNPPVLGAPLDIIEFGILQAPSLGNASINQNGTLLDKSDDFINYVPNSGATGLETFSYFIVTEDGTRSTAQVTIAVGDADANDLVGINFDLVDASGNAIANDAVNVGDRFGVRITVDDLRSSIDSTLVYAAFLDVLYDAGLISVADTSSTDRFDFDVAFGANFDAGAAVGSAARPGIIDEFGTQDERSSVPLTAPIPDPRVLATVFFVAEQSGTTRIVGSPADASPFQDTLLLNRNEPVPRSQIRYDVLEITIGGGEGEFPLQNSSLPADVNGDGFVSPIDALTVINDLNRQALMMQLESEQLGDTPLGSRYFTDVNGDKKVTALDALMVINFLNVRSQALAAVEGELVVSDQLPAPVVADASHDLRDDAIMTLTPARDRVVSVAGSESPASSSLLAPPETSASPEDDEDFLSLLADDVAGIWG